MWPNASLAWLIVLTIQVLASPAHAADSANMTMIGYSQDFRYFAFEQFGIQDGSGYPYSEIFVIDLDNNEWVKGSPVRHVLEEDGATLGAAHSAAIARARPLMDALEITEPAMLLADLPATQVGLNRISVAFDQWYNSIAGPAAPQPDGSSSRLVLSIEAIDVPKTGACTTYDDPVKGFELSIMRHGNSEKTEIIHRDTSLPKSRGCPVAYDIAAVAAPAGEPESPTMVALIGVYTWGFEGQDRRYIAVPFK